MLPIAGRHINLVEREAGGKCSGLLLFFFLFSFFSQSLLLFSFFFWIESDSDYIIKLQHYTIERLGDLERTVAAMQRKPRKGSHPAKVWQLSSTEMVMGIEVPLTPSFKF